MQFDDEAAKDMKCKAISDMYTFPHAVMTTLSYISMA